MESNSLMVQFLKFLLILKLELRNPPSASGVVRINSSVALKGCQVLTLSACKGTQKDGSHVSLALRNH